MEWSWGKHQATSERFAKALLNHIDLLQDFPCLLPHRRTAKDHRSASFLARRPEGTGDLSLKLPLRIKAGEGLASARKTFKQRRRAPQI